MNTVTWTNIKGTTDTKCKQAEVCTVVWTCSSCEIGTGSLLSYEFEQVKSYSSRIVANLTSSSSIPSEVSSIEQSTTSKVDMLYRGSQFTNIYFDIIPSVSSSQVFLTDSSMWQTDQTGYHVSYSKVVHEGSVTTIQK